MSNTAIRSAFLAGLGMGESGDIARYSGSNDSWEAAADDFMARYHPTEPSAAPVMPFTQAQHSELKIHDWGDTPDEQSLYEFIDSGLALVAWLKQQLDAVAAHGPSARTEAERTRDLAIIGMLEAIQQGKPK